jgi:hypothetical protein
MTGDKRSFSLNINLSVVHVPLPAARDWTRRTLTCVVALQCSPSKDRLAPISTTGYVDPRTSCADITFGRRQGIPYPEWNAWTNSFLPDHVAVVERICTGRGGESAPLSVDLRKWFEEDTPSRDDKRSARRAGSYRIPFRHPTDEISTARTEAEVITPPDRDPDTPSVSPRPKPGH